MTDESSTFDWSGARFVGEDFAGTTFRECDMRDVKIVGCVLSDLVVTGFSGRFGRIVVEGVDITDFVISELDRRHPERVQLRAVESAGDFRAMWETIERMWEATVDRARTMSPPALETRVDGEWSFVETLRHLVFATDVWLGRMTLGERGPFHPLGLPPTDYPSAAATALGLRTDSRPSLDEVLAARLERVAHMRALLAELTESDLDEMRSAEPATGWGVATLPVRRCLRVVLNEECEHHRYAVRDLGRLDDAR